MEYYENTDTHEIVYEDDLEEYAMKQLGIVVEPIGVGNAYTLEQEDFISTFTEWYFGDSCWIKKKEKDDTDTYDSTLEDLIYENNLETRLLEEE